MRIIKVALAVACLTASGLAGAAEPQASARKVIHIAAQALEPALQAFSRERGLQVVYRSETVGDLQTRGAAGELTADEALTQLLKGTGLTFEYLDERTVTIAPLPVKSGVRKDVKNSETLMLALATGEEPVRPNTGESSANSSGNAGVQEIVVTATKRAENIRDVPLSITAITAEEIERRGLVGAEDYLRGIPAANQTELGWSGQAIVIRGLETNVGAQNGGAGATTATYFGETPTTGSAGQLGSNVDIKLVDIERVEVLRGPQGTAFGNSSIGGAVRVIPAAPNMESFDAKVRAGYSATAQEGGGNHFIQAVGNLPLVTDQFAVRAVAYQFLDSGFYRNRAGSDPAAQALAASMGAQAFAVDDNEAGQVETTGGRIAAAFKPSQDLKLTASYLTQKTEVDGWATATAGTYDQVIFRVAPAHVRRGTPEGVADSDIDIANALVEYNLGWGNLVATYSHIKSESVLMHPYTEVPFPWATSDGRDMEVRSNVGEIRLSTNLDGAWNFLGGLYYEKNDDDYDTTIIWYGSDAARTTTFPGSTDNLLGVGSEIRETTQKAAFAEASWQLLPRLTLTGGARAYWYDRTADIHNTGYFNGGARPPIHLESDDSGSNFRANLSYKLEDGDLVYGSWTQGFRLGKPLAGLPVATCDVNNDGLIDGTGNSIESTRQLDSDAVDSYEVGGKFRMLDRRLAIDAAVFRMDWTDIPVTVAAPCLISYPVNAGSARSEGVELQANLQITESTRVDVGGSWINARLTKDVPAENLSAGDRLAGSPRVNANLGLAQEFDLGGRRAFVRADAIYVGKLYSRISEAANTEAGDYVKLDVSAGLAFTNLDVSVYARNVTDEDAFTMRSNYGLSSAFHGYRMRPRTIGVQLGYRFGL